jgi:hypothetical protein
MPFSTGRQKAGEAFGAAPAPHAEQAFGAKPVPALWRLGARLAERARLAVLLLCLGLAVAALAVTDNVVEEGLGSVFSGGSGGSGDRTAVPSIGPCPNEQLSELASLRSDQMLYVRATVQYLAERAGGQEYASGTVYPRDAWSDDAPDGAVAERPTVTRWPGSYEIREWAPDPQWGAGYRDDIVVDAFVFPSSGQARRFFMQAAGARCRRSASTVTAGGPPGARYLNWVNPDGATEEDVYLNRRRVVYRVADVRPQDHNPPPSQAEDRVGFATLEALACAIPGAGCGGGPVGASS